MVQLVEGRHGPSDAEEEEEDCHLDESGWLCTQLQISSWCLKSISLAENKIQVKGQLNTTNEILVASKIRLKHNCQSNAPKGNINDGKGIKMQAVEHFLKLKKCEIKFKFKEEQRRCFKL